MVEFSPREVGPGQPAMSAGWTICEVVPFPELHLASHPEMAPPTHPSLPAPQPSPVQALSKSWPSTKNSPMAALFPKGPRKHASRLLSPASLLPQARSIRQSHVVNGILFVTWVVGRGSGWTSPNLHEHRRQAFLRQSGTGDRECHEGRSRVVHLSRLPTVDENEA